jgi:hypothetical protein
MPHILYIEIYQFSRTPFSSNAEARNGFNLIFKSTKCFCGSGKKSQTYKRVMTLVDGLEKMSNVGKKRSQKQRCRDPKGDVMQQV